MLGAEYSLQCIMPSDGVDNLIPGPGVLEPGLFTACSFGFPKESVPDSNQVSLLMREVRDFV